MGPQDLPTTSGQGAICGPTNGKLCARSGLAGPFQIRMSLLPSSEDLTETVHEGEKGQQAAGSPSWWGYSSPQTLPSSPEEDICNCRKHDGPVRRMES